AAAYRQVAGSVVSEQGSVDKQYEQHGDHREGQVWHAAAPRFGMGLSVIGRRGCRGRSGITAASRPTLAGRGRGQAWTAAPTGRVGSAQPGAESTPARAHAS